MMRGKSLQLGYRKKAIFKQKCAVTKTKNTVFVDNHLRNFVLKFQVSSFKTALKPLKKCQKKLERKITQLFEKKRIEKLHKLHTATENLNPKL